MLISDVRPSEFSPKPRIAAIAGGLGYLMVLLGSWYWAYGSLIGLRNLLLEAHVGPWLWWAFLGGALVGGVLAVLLVQYNLLSPIIVVAAVYGVATYLMLTIVQPPYLMLTLQALELPLPGTPYDLYLVGWPLLLGAAVAIGYLEHRLQAGRSPNGLP